jgi:hypothetical protein
MAANDEQQGIVAGARVVHPDLGPGTVRRLKRDGRAALVSFDTDAALLLEVKARELRPEGERARPAAKAAKAPAASGAGAGAPPPPGAGPAPTPPEPRGAFRQRAGAPRPPDDVADAAAQTLEALRLGVVPHADLRAASVGRDGELSLVAADLTQTAESGAARVFLGDYGTGKTHMLELVEREALARGFVVGRATLDAQYVRPNHPQRVYRSAMTALAYPDVGGDAAPGLEPLLRRAVTDDALMAELDAGQGPFAEHLYLAPALHWYRELLTVEDPVPRDLLLDWVEGQRPEGNEELDTELRRLLREAAGRRLRSGPPIYSLKDFQPWAHVYSYLLGGLGVLARRVGYTGLVVLLDEAENYDLLGSEARSFADSVFRCLTLAALGEGGVLFGPETIEKGGFPPQKRLPLVFRWPQHLYVVAAMTPSTRGEDLLRRLIAPERLNELKPLTPEDYHELSRRVTALFERAFPEMRIPERLNRPLGDVLWALIRNQHIQNPREATKLTVEFLDLLRLRPDALQSFFGDVERVLGR